MAEVEIERLRRQVAELEGTPTAQPASPASLASDAPPLPPVEAPAGNREGIAFDRPSERQVKSEELPAVPVTDSARNPETTVLPPTSGAALADPAKAQEVYDRGYTLYHQGRLVDSESAFRQFLQAHPTSDLADNAQFWIGAARLQRGDVGGALAAFRETIERFPGGNKVPDAMLKSGECLERLGDSEEARRVYRDVIDRFPTTAASALARERLGELP